MQALFRLIIVLMALSALTGCASMRLPTVATIPVQEQTDHLNNPSCRNILRDLSQPERSVIWCMPKEAQ